MGAAPCPPEVIEFWHALGVPLGEIYGMSETTGLATANRPEAIRIGTVGPATSACEVKLGENNEVLMRGPVIMRGYRNLPDKTAEAIDEDGWLHSGDVGEFDDDGYLRIVDRIKELIINAAGKNMSPANIEATVKASSDLIGQACCIGDARPYNVALIVLDPEVAAAFAQRHGRPDGSLKALARDERVREEIEAAIERANEKLARVEQIKRFTILENEWLAGLRRADPDDEAQASAGGGEVREGDRGAVLVGRCAPGLLPSCPGVVLRHLSSNVGEEDGAQFVEDIAEAIHHVVPGVAAEVVAARTGLAVAPVLPTRGVSVELGVSSTVSVLRPAAVHECAAARLSRGAVAGSRRLDECLELLSVTSPRSTRSVLPGAVGRRAPLCARPYTPAS